MSATLRALWVLGRPRLLPFVLALVWAGFGWAHWDRALMLQGGQRLAWVLAAWTALHAGTLWLNAALDQDEGEVLWGEAIRAPAVTALAGHLGLLLAVLMAFGAGPVAGGACALCAALAELYSHPLTLWKGHPVGGPVVNLMGYGLLSPLAGWAAAGVEVNARTLWVWPVAGLGVLGAYFAAQAFQEEEDRARGYRTLVVTHGPRGALLATRLCLGGAVLAGLGLAVTGWLPRVLLLCAPGALWVDQLLVTWSQQPGGGDASWARRFTGRLVVVGSLAVTFAFAEYARESLMGEPVAGLGTPSGTPADRPLLPPEELRVWELRNGGVVQVPGE